MSTQEAAALAEEKKKGLPLPNLEDYFVSSVKFCVNDEWKPESEEHGKLATKATVRNGRNSDDRIVALKVRVDPRGEKWNGPYVFEAEALAHLSGCATDGFSKERVDAHAVMIAAPILFGVIRDLGAILTAQLPGPKMILPLVPPAALADGYERED